MIISIIPARGGSKSIPLKNIRPLNDKPLLLYSVDYAKACPLIEHTVVSTDSEAIAEIARSCGAEVPFIRPAEFAQDDTQDFPVMKHALEALESIYGKKIEIIVLLRPTSPLRPLGLIERAVEILRTDPNCSSVRAVMPATEHFYRQWIPDGPYIRGVVTDVKEPYNLPRQQLPVSYFQTGDIEAFRRETVLAGSVSGKNVAPLIISPDEIMDIDYIEDFKEAEKRINGNR